MPNNNRPQYEYLDHNGVLELAKGILDIVNDRIRERITDTVDPADNLHVPSAAAVYNAITASKHVSMKPVTGDINVVVPEDKRSTNVIYLQRDSESDKTWQMYIWIVTDEVQPNPTYTGEEGQEENITVQVGSWFCLGDTDINLENYLQKTPEDIEYLKAQLGLDDKVDVSQMEKITQFELKNILDEAAHKTAAFTPTYTLTINYLNVNGNNPVAEAHVQSGMHSGDTYSVPSPTVDGYSTNGSSAVVSGSILYSDVTVNVIYYPEVAEGEDEITEW